MPQNRWFMLLVLFLVRVSMGFQFQSVASVAPSLVDAFGIDYARIGTLIGLYMLPGVALALPGGLLGVRFGDKRVTLAALALMATGGAILGLSDSYTLAVLGRLLSGIGGAVFSVVMTKMLTDWFAGREIVAALGIFINSWPVGIGLALLIQGRLATAYSWPVVFLVTAVLCAISLLLLALFYRDPPATAVGRDRPAESPRLTREELSLICLAGVIWALYNVGYLFTFSFAPLLLQQQGLSVVEAGSLSSLTMWLSMISVPLGGVLAQRLRVPNLFMLVGFVLTGATLLALPYLRPSIWPFVALGLIGGAPAGIIMSLPAEILRAASRGPGMGVFYTLFYGGMAALPVLGGWAQDLAGSAAAPVRLGASMFFVICGVLLVFRLMQRRLVAVMA